MEARKGQDQAAQLPELQRWSSLPWATQNYRTVNTMIKVKIDVTKILKEHLFAGAKGTYLDATLLDNRDGEDQYGNHYIVVQEISKDARDAGERGPILGNARIYNPHAKSETVAPPNRTASNSLPF